MSRYRVKFTYTFPGTVLPPGDYLGTCVPRSVTRSPSEQPHQRSFSRARLHGRCRSHPLRQPECSGNSISPYPPTPPSLLAAMLRSIPGWRALHPGRHPICPPHFPAQEGRQRGEKGRRNHPSRTCNRVAATASCRRHTGRARTGAMQSLLHRRRHVPGQSLQDDAHMANSPLKQAKMAKKEHSGGVGGGPVKELVTPHPLTPPTLCLIVLVLCLSVEVG